MRRTDWWLGVLLIALSILAHAMLPRYEYRHPGLGYAGNVASGAYYTGGYRWPGEVWIRIDRWTGRAVLVTLDREKTGT